MINIKDKTVDIKYIVNYFNSCYMNQTRSYSVSEAVTVAMKLSSLLILQTLFLFYPATKLVLVVFILLIRVPLTV